MVDPEIDAMSAVATALAKLEEQQQGRVLRWAAERYGVTLGKSSGRRAAAVGHEADISVDDDATEDEVTAEDPTFQHFGDLFASADPKSNEDKALVAAIQTSVRSRRSVSGELPSI